MQETSWSPRNWGTVAAVLMSSVVTLAGIALQLTPETLLLRAAVSGAIVFAAVTLTVSVCRTPRIDEEE
jgi:hypothetical protein